MRILQQEDTPFFQRNTARSLFSVINILPTEEENYNKKITSQIFQSKFLLISLMPLKTFIQTIILQPQFSVFQKVPLSINLESDGEKGK